MCNFIALSIIELMRRLLIFIPLFSFFYSFSQVPAYYNNVNLTLTGQAMKTELSNKITVTHTTNLSYSPGVWDALKQTDLDPSNSNKVLLIYGYNDSDGNPITDKTRNKNDNGGNVGDWNREHVYPKSLGAPDLGTSGPGADAHHLRNDDVQMNGNRGSRKFAAGSGNASTTGSNWYPGDEWKGDVARMMMYMYLRYGSQCLPNNVGIGSSVAGDPSMIDLFLQWNVEDTVSQYEINRNNILETEQGNRNPFIDNPYLATVIWNGTIAQDKWNMVSVYELVEKDGFYIYPNPLFKEDLHIYLNNSKKVDMINVYNVNGQLIYSESIPKIEDNKIIVQDIPQGFFFVSITSEGKTTTSKFVVK